MPELKVGIIGAGYWGPNLVRNFSEAPGADVVAVADLDPEVFTPAIEGSALEGARPDLPVNCPAWVLRADPSLGAAFTPDDEALFMATNPGATVEVVQGASHAIHDEQPDHVLAVIRRFLDTLA